MVVVCCLSAESFGVVFHVRSLCTIYGTVSCSRAEDPSLLVLSNRSVLPNMFATSSLNEPCCANTVRHHYGKQHPSEAQRLQFVAPTTVGEADESRVSGRT